MSQFSGVLLCTQRSLTTNIHGACVMLAGVLDFVVVRLQRAKIALIYLVRHGTRAMVHLIDVAQLATLVLGSIGEAPREATLDVCDGLKDLAVVDPPPMLVFGITGPG